MPKTFDRSVINRLGLLAALLPAVAMSCADVDDGVVCALAGRCENESHGDGRGSVIEDATSPWYPETGRATWDVPAHFPVDARSDAGRPRPDTGVGIVTDFPAGVFQLTTLGIQDGCLDGGPELLFMPLGAHEPYDLAHTTEFYAHADLPKTYTIMLQAPFSAMQVTVERDGPSKMKVEDAVQTDVIVDVQQYADCNADAILDADILIVDRDRLSLTVGLRISGWRSTGDTCPNVAADPCRVVLDMSGVRLP